VTNPFYDNGPNDKGIAIQLAHSLLRVALGFGLACLVAIPLGFVIGMSPAAAKGI
jgi:nitrate/nitrite transport system permease protein